MPFALGIQVLGAHARQALEVGFPQDRAGGYQLAQVAVFLLVQAADYQQGREADYLLVPAVGFQQALAVGCLPVLAVGCLPVLEGGSRQVPGADVRLALEIIGGA